MGALKGTLTGGCSSGWWVQGLMPKGLAWVPILSFTPPGAPRGICHELPTTCELSSAALAFPNNVQTA
eukprot:1139886-Pelagomonas_calceolata.AAC.7